MPFEYQFQRIDGTYNNILVANNINSGQWLSDGMNLLGNQYSGNTTTYTTHKWKFVSWTQNGFLRTYDYYIGDVYIYINRIYELSVFVRGWWYDGQTFRFTFDIAERVGVNYNVNYNGNGSDGGSTGSNTAIYGSNFTFQANGFTRTGYTFFRWALNSDGNFIGYYNEGQLYGIWTMTSSNVIVYAEWSAKTSSIIYDANGVTVGSTTSNTATYGSSFTFQANGFTRTGYTFGGWHLYDGTTRINQKTYNSGESYGNWDKTETSYTAKAQWTPATATYTITYIADLPTGLYNFTPHTFTNAGATGRLGPEITQVRLA
jgi:hypothetical protein